MRLLIVCFIGLLSVAVQAASDVDAYRSDEDKAVYCFAAHSLRMQLQGMTVTDPAVATQLIKNAERWQAVVEKQLTNPETFYPMLQEVNQVLGRRMESTGGDPRAMNDIIAPMAADCDALLARLDPPVSSKSISGAPLANDTSIQSQPVDADKFAGLLDTPLRGDFRWNPHSTIYAAVKTKGTLKPLTGGAERFQLDFDSKITTLCVGELIESHRSEDGYLMHLKVKSGSGAGTGEGCEPRVTRGVLFPFALDDSRSTRQLMLRLYDAQNRLITSSRFTSKAVEQKGLDQEKLQALLETARSLEAVNEEARRGDKLANLQQQPGYSRLAPFYQSCMASASSVSGVVEPSSYCVCMTYKFGVGERIPEAEFISYTEDFGRLVDRFRVFTDDNKLYTRLAETCRSCSSPSGALHPGCDEPDSNLLVPQNFAEMIQQMDKPTVRLESSTLYKENFFVIYLQRYSDYCERHIENPIPFDFVVTEHTTDPYAGTFSNEVQRDRTYVERKHASRYQAIYDKHRKMNPEDFWNGIMDLAITSEADFRRSQTDLKNRIRWVTEKHQSVEEHLEKGCTSDSVQRVYSNLDQLF